MSTSDTNEVSPEATPIDAVIREYLLRIDRGEEISHKELLAGHPDLHDDLQAFFEGVALVQKMAGAPSALTETSPPTKFDTKYATVATPEDGSSDVNSKTSHSKSAADLTGPFPIMLGQYRVLKNIGQGAMGAVYVADDIRLGRKVALKVPLAAVVERPDHLDRFTREARASARLRHHNICPVYEVNEQDGIQYIAMAFIEGQPLLEVLRKNRRYSGKQIAVTIRKIALALEVAHRAGIVHRDLKPANIMIDKEGEPIVMDFGLARQMHSVDQVQLTKEGVILGTPAYMSPEQVRSELKRIGPASDIYSLGVILYELLCGSHPFRGPLMTVLMNVADKNISPRKPSEIRANCDPQLEAICMRMISKRIADRYSSMKDVAAALSQYIKTGQTAPEISTTEPPVNPTPAEPVAIAAVTPPPQINSLQTESGGISKPPRRRVGVLFGGFLAALLAGVIIITITNRNGSQSTLTVPDTSKVDISHKADAPPPPK